MDIAIIENGNVVRLGHYKILFPDTSFVPNGPDAEFLEQNNALGVTVWKPHDKATQKLVPVTPYIEDGQVFTVEVVDKTEDDINYDTLALATSIRTRRNLLLTSSDWTQVLDAPVDRDKWATYRQLLRDITLIDGFPVDIEWPISPINNQDANIDIPLPDNAINTG